MFKKALPVWVSYASNHEKLNRHLVFRQSLGSLIGVTLNLAAVDFYRLTVNGIFVGFGPARTAKGYARVDSYDLSDYNNANGENEIIIEVSGFFCKSLSTERQNSFLCAEVILNGDAIKYTGRDFECFDDVRFVRKVERFSVQRHFGEIRDERRNPFSDEHRIKPRPISENIKFIERHVPLASCEVFDIDRYISKGSFVEGDPNDETLGRYGTGKKKNAYSFSPHDYPDYGVFKEDEIEDKPFRFIGAATQTKTSDGGEMPVKLSMGEWLMVDLDLIHAGFLRFSAETNEESDVIVAFSELCDTDTFYFRRISMQNVIEYKLPANIEYNAESFEPYTFRHVAIFVKNGSITLKSIGFRSFERDRRAAIKREFKSPVLNEIYNTALRTFAHNAVDLYSDCPSRERAGWLCDSFFSGRAEYFLYGDSVIEDAFLENFVLYKNEGDYPDGVLPMCYPSDSIKNGQFIPQWDIWYVLEVCEYLTERRPNADREFFRPSVLGVLDFLKKHENQDGFLEDLPSWNFIEWSDANSWTQNVSYPTNFLYAGMLDLAGKTFNESALCDKAKKIREKAIARSFNGEVFVDHAIRNGDGSYTNQKHISEACQYYAILYGGVDIEDKKYARLKQYVIDNFSSFDKGDNEFCAINAFIGLYLRMNVLMNMGYCELLAKNVETFCLNMSRTTGTLWEYREAKNSLDHGFASYLALAIPFADKLS